MNTLDRANRAAVFCVHTGRPEDRLVINLKLRGIKGNSVDKFRSQQEYLCVRLLPIHKENV